MDVRRRHADKIYIDPLSGEPMAKPGCFQLAFCDRGTPKDGGGFNMYQAIKDELVARGVPAAEVRFVHEARKPSEITILREQCINGDVSVLKAAKRWLHRDTEKVPAQALPQLAQVRAAYPALDTMVTMREELRQLWLNRAQSREQLAADLQAWCHRAEESGIAALQEFSLRLRAARA